MNNIESVLAYLQSIFPRRATNSEIMVATGVNPHQQVFQITKKLKIRGEISSIQIGREWFFQANSDTQVPNNISVSNDNNLNRYESNDFEDYARKVLISHFGKTLHKGKIEGINKIWDLLSEDHDIVGDIKFYSLVNRVSDPPAKFSTISEHVWLLEKIVAETKILVFGNQIEVPQRWLKKYGDLVVGVEFYFLDDEKNLISLN